MFTRHSRRITASLALLAAAACQSTSGGEGSSEGATHSGAAPKTTPAAVYDKTGFVVIEDDGRLWVFKEGSEELDAFHEGGELAKHVIRPGAGPDGMTIKGPDSATLLEYVAARPGFVVKAHDGRLWIFAEDSEELALFEENGELAKHVIRPGAGPMGTTLKAPDTETLDAYQRLLQ